MIYIPKFFTPAKEKNDSLKFTTLKEQQIKRKRFQNGDTTNWSYNLFESTESIEDTIPSLRIANLPERLAEKPRSPRERFNEALLKKTKLSKKINVIKALGLSGHFLIRREL